MKRIDHSMTRRSALPLVGIALPALLSLDCAHGQEKATRGGDRAPQDTTTNDKSVSDHRGGMQIQYLEIVTKDVEKVCSLYSKVHGVTFGDVDENLGGARTAKLASGGMLGVRAPLHDGEKAVVRPYILVDDIEAAVAAVEKLGAEIVVPPMKIAGHGTCAIYFGGEIELGLWQV